MDPDETEPLHTLDSVMSAADEIDRLRARITVLETTVAWAADNLDAYGYPQTAAAARSVLGTVEDQR